MPERQGLEWTFNTNADTYAKMRPGYPPELYADIFAYCPVGPSSHVVEIGIGGGQATLPVLQQGCRLTAVEYGDRLAELCRQRFQTYPAFSAIVARFEDVDFEEASVDLVFSASAFHWIPEAIGYPKVFALLKSGGAFARFANHPYKDKGREALHQALQRLYAVYMPNARTPHAYTDEDAQSLAALAGRYGFVDVRHRLYHRKRTFTATEYLALLSTYSDHIAIEETTRNRFFSAIQGTIEDAGGVIDIYDTIDMQLARKP